MSDWLTAPGNRRIRTVLRWVVGVVFLGGLVRTWFDLAQVTPGIGLGDRIIAELLVIGTIWAPDAPGPLPWTLNVARVVVPVTGTLFAALLLADAFTVVRSLTRNHTVLVGTGAAASAMASLLRGPDGVHGRVLRAEEGDRDSLRGAGVRHARAAVVCGDDTFDTATNIATAGAAMGLAAHERFTAHLLVGDPGLALALRARRLVQKDDREHRIRVFTVDELAVRHHVRDMPMDGQTSPHVLVVGSSAFGKAVIVEFARRWWRDGDRSGTPVVTLVARDAGRAIHEITDRWPFVANTCALQPQEQQVEQALVAIPERPYRSYFCDDDEERALRMAMTAATRWPSEAGSIVVRLGRLAAQSGAHADLFDDLGSLDQLSVYDAAAREIVLADRVGRHTGAPTPELLRAAAEVDPLLAFARGIHDSYLDDALRRGEKIGSRPLLVSWELLPDEARHANVRQAASFPRTLAAIGCSVAPRSRLADPFFFRPGEVETLAQREHTHWITEQRRRGWRFGRTRNDRRKVHPLLVPWEKLSNADRSRNRAIVRARPLLFDRVLEREGLQIVRLAAGSVEIEPAPGSAPDWLTPAAVDRLAPLVHESYLQVQTAHGVAMYSEAAMRPWAELSEDLRESNRANVRDIPSKLDLLEATVTTRPPVRPFAFADDELEMLARYEHDRWLTQRLAAGWTYGAERDDVAKVSHHLVPWLYLPQRKRDIDRDLILGIPKQLEAVGLFVTRK